MVLSASFFSNIWEGELNYTFTYAQETTEQWMELSISIHYYVYYIYIYIVCNLYRDKQFWLSSLAPW